MCQMEHDQPDLPREQLPGIKQVQGRVDGVLYHVGWAQQNKLMLVVSQGPGRARFFFRACVRRVRRQIHRAFHWPWACETGVNGAAL